MLRVASAGSPRDSDDSRHALIANCLVKQSSGQVEVFQNERIGWIEADITNSEDSADLTDFILGKEVEDAHLLAFDTKMPTAPGAPELYRP